MLYFGNTGTSCQKNAKALHTTTTTNYISSLKKEIDCLKYPRIRFCLTIIFPYKDRISDSGSTLSVFSPSVFVIPCTLDRYKDCKTWIRKSLISASDGNPGGLPGRTGTVICVNKFQWIMRREPVKLSLVIS